MRITSEVDIPDKLIEAAADGSLVLFVGAGVSLNAPSNLPLFDGLAEKLAYLQGIPFDKDVPPDAFVGRLCDLNPVVREQARSIIAAPGSQPNDTHHAIVQLAKASAAFRVVTTNYDEHLTRAAAAAGVDVGDVYHGPAVPLGRDFKGLVYLHGRVSRPAYEMVLTDDDFGRAYLTDGWARTFVQDLFMNRTVLFIGYSHNDSVMKYLARGLPPTTSRFALTDIPDDAKWRDLRITPVSYPGENNHSALTAALDAWADRLAMGHLDHRTRVKEICQGAPPKLPVEADYIAYAVNTPAGVRAFAEEALGPAWLRWAEDQQVFKDLFTAGDCSSEESRILASWFVDKYVADPDTPDLALRTLARLGPVVCNELMGGIARTVYILGKSSPDLSRRWSAVVSGALRTHAGDPTELWLHLYGSNISGAYALSILRRATRPRLVLNEVKPWFTADVSEDGVVGVKGTVAWSSTESDIQQLWTAVQEALPTIATSILQIFEQSMLDAYDLVGAVNGDTTWDSWSFRRSAIEPHSQDQMRDYESVLIDGLRDASTLLAVKDKTIMRRWLSYPHALFRRLGIHLLTEDSDFSPHEKVKSLLDGRHLFDGPLKHEVFRLVATIAAQLSEEDKEPLLAQILEGPPPFKTDAETDAVLHQRSIFDVTEWISRYVQGWQKLEEVIKDIRINRPEIGVREHPDFDHWIESGTWGGELPYEVDDFIGLIESNGVDEAVQQLVNRDYSERNFDEPTWDDACSLVRQVVAKRPEIGQELVLSPATKDTERKNDLMSATIRGWSDATLSDVLMMEALQRIEMLVDRPDFANSISELCVSAVSKVETREPNVLEELDTIASRIWSANESSYEDPGSDDWLFLGLNTWPGLLAQYWINRIRLRWQAKGDDWDGLTPLEKAMISRMLETKTAVGNPALAVLARDVYFLFAADNTYTVKNIFPIFDMEKDARARHAWISYLHYPRANDALLEGGFWELLAGISAHILDFSDEQVGRLYWRLAASICVRSGATTVGGNQFTERLAEQHSGDQLVSFINALADVLSEVEDAEADRAWSSWIRGTVRGRVQSPPGVQSLAEKGAWGDMALRIGAPIVEAVKLCNGMPGPLGPGTTFAHIPDKIFTTHANLLAEVVTHRIQATPVADWHIEHELNSLVPRLKENAVDGALLRVMAESALNIGMHSASYWIT